MRKPSTPSDGGKRNYALIGAIIFCIILLPILLIQIRSNNSSEQFSTPQFREEEEKINQEKQPQINVTVDNLLNNIEKKYQILEDFLINEELLARVTERCSNMSQHNQLLDVECSAAWFYHLKYGEITNVYELLGFEDTHWGAIILEVDNKYKAMFKPCSTKSEDTTKEVIASHIDQVLGYGQTAPSIARRIKSETIEKYSTTQVAYQRFIQTKEKCEMEDGFFEGPMIGWWNNITPVRTVRKYKVPIESMLDMRKNLSENLYTTQLQSRYQSFYWLINILRHGKDEFITKEGNLVALDLDRSRYNTAHSPTELSINFTWCYTCYFDEWTYETFRAISPKSKTPLSHLMEKSLAHEDIFSGLYNSKIGEILNTRVDQYLQCATRCIDIFGRENVILNRRTTMSEKDIVDWFVNHSEYKNQNGKKPPSWFKKDH